HLRPPTFTLFPYTTLFRSGLQPVIGYLSVSSSKVGDIFPPRFSKNTKQIRSLSNCCYFCEMNVLDEFYYRQTDAIREVLLAMREDRKSTRLNSSHVKISYA